jgi:hypothetical protein
MGSIGFRVTIFGRFWVIIQDPQLAAPAVS